jgi:hypothetical protein
MNFLETSIDLLKTSGKKIYDFFPKTLTFWSVLFYFFFFYFIVYIAFSIYIYVNGLEYEIDCENTDKCLKIKKRDDNPDNKNNLDNTKIHESIQLP